MKYETRFSDQQMSRITPRQREVFLALCEFIDLYNYPPSFSELCNHLDLKSRGSLHKHIQALVNCELVEPLEGKQRGIQPRQSIQSKNTLPYLGKIAAGLPIEAVPDVEHIEVPELLTGNGECFVLMVNGESMIEGGIMDGDYVIIEKSQNIHNGDIVVALIDQNDVTLKQFQRQKDKIVLQPMNQSMQAQRYSSDRVVIQGKLIGQMRRY